MQSCMLGVLSKLSEAYHLHCEKKEIIACVALSPSYIPPHHYCSSHLQMHTIPYLQRLRFVKVIAIASVLELESLGNLSDH